MVLRRFLLVLPAALLLSLSACRPKEGEAVLVVSPGDRLRAQLGPDLFGFSGQLDGAELVEGTKNSTAVPGVLDYSSDRTEISFKLARGRSADPRNLLKAELRMESGESLPLRTFVAVEPLTLDFSTERTVRFFEKILQRDPKSPEEVLFVLKQFRGAMTKSCLAGKPISSVSLANRAFNNALSASPNAQELISTFALNEDQRAAFIQSNTLPSATGGFPFPLADRINEMSVPESVESNLDVEVMDADRDLFLSEWTLDEKPFAETPDLQLKELREARLDLPELFRAARGFSFRTDYAMSTKAKAKRHEIKLTLCDGAQPVVYRYALNITNSNRAPEMTSPVPPQPIEVQVGQEVKLNLRFKDIDGDVLMYSPLTSVTANFVMSPDAANYEGAEILKGSFQFQEDSRNRYDAQSWPELGNPWLEGVLNRGSATSADRSPPKELSFYTNSSGQTRARVKTWNTASPAVLVTQDVPVSFDHYVDPVSGLVNHLQFTLGSETEGLSLTRPFVANGVRMKCHAFPRGFGLGFSMQIACGAERFPDNLEFDGAWTAIYGCPDSEDPNNPNPRCFPQTGRLLSQENAEVYESEIGLHFRPTRDQVTLGSATITQSFLVSDQAGGAVPVAIKFRVLDVDAPRVAPLRFVQFKLLEHLSLSDLSGPFQSTSQTTSLAVPYDYYQRSGSVASFSLLKPFRRTEEVEKSSRNVFAEPPGNLRKAYFRGPAGFERQEWWQHVRWELEDRAGTFPSDPLKDRSYLRFLSKANGQRYAKLVLSKKNCSDLACNLNPFSPSTSTNRGDVPNSTDADVLEYEILSSSPQAFSFRIPVGGLGDGRPLFCHADFLFPRVHQPTPSGEVAAFTDPSHGNFRLRCSQTSLEDAKAAATYVQYGPGLTSFLSESVHPTLPSPGAEPNFLVFPNRDHAWTLRSCALYKNNKDTAGTRGAGDGSTIVSGAGTKASPYRVVIGSASWVTAKWEKGSFVNYDTEVGPASDLEVVDVVPSSRTVHLVGNSAQLAGLAGVSPIPTGKKFYASYLNGTGCESRPELSTLLSKFSAGLRLPADKAVMPASYDPLSDSFVDLLITDSTTLKISPRTSRVEFSAAFAGANYRWCRYGFRSLLNTLVLTCSKTQPSGEYPALYEVDTAAPDRFATFHLGYAPEVRTAEASTPWKPDRGYLGRVLEAYTSTLTDEAGANGRIHKIQDNSLKILPGSKKALMGFKLRYDGSSWARPTAGLRPARPELKSAKVYAYPEGGFAGDDDLVEVTTNPLSIWRSDYEGLGRPVPATAATPTIKLEMTGVGRLEDEEFLVAWLTSTPGRYRFVLEFEQPGLPPSENRVTFMADALIKDFTFPPTLNLVDYGVNNTWTGTPTASLQIKQTRPSGAPPIFMKPVILEEQDGAQKSIFVTVGETIPVYKLMDRNSRVIDVGLKLTSEKSTATAFWLTERVDVGGGVYRTSLVDPEKSPDWYSRVPVTKTATLLASGARAPGSFLVDASAIIRKDDTHYFLSPSDEGAVPEVAATQELSGGETTHKAVLLPRAPLNAITQESQISSLGPRLFKLVRAQGITNLAAGITTQLFVAAEAGGLQSVTKLRLGGEDYIADLDSKMGGSEIRENSPGVLTIRDLRLSGTDLVPQSGHNLSCRLYLLYEPVLVDRGTKVGESGDQDKGSRTLARYVCQPGTSSVFPTSLTSTTPWEDIGTAPLDGLVAFEAEAFNPGPFTLGQKQPEADKQFQAVANTYQGELARILWGQSTQPNLTAAENTGSFAGVIVVASGDHLILQPIVFLAHREPPKATLVQSPNPCATSYSPVLRAAVADTPIRCSLPRLDFSDGASIASLTFQSDVPGATNVGAFILPASGEAPVGNVAKKRVYAINNTSSGWQGYNGAPEYSPLLELNHGQVELNPGGWPINQKPYFEFFWKFPTFARIDATDKQTTVRWVAGLDHHRLLYSDQVECAFNHCINQPNINRVNLGPPYTFPHKIYGQRDVEWATKASTPNGWENAISFSFVEENLPPCVVPNSGTFAVGAACPSANDLISSLTNSFTSVEQPTAGATAPIRDIVLRMTEAAPFPAGSVASDKVFEGRAYSFKLRAFDQNNSQSNIRYMGDWSQLAGPTTTIATSSIGGLHQKEADVRYTPLDAHVSRTSPYSPVELKFRISDAMPDSSSNSSPDVSYTLKLDVWDVNVPPAITIPASPVTYTGSSTFVARTMTFSVRDPDIGDGVEIRYLGTSADVFVTCFEESSPGVSNSLKSGDLVMRIEPNGTVITGGANGGRCGGQTLQANSGGSTPTYTLRLKFWDEPDLNGVPVTAFNFEIRDLPWWTLSSADNYIDNGVPKQYRDRHPQPALVNPSKAQVISLMTQLNATPRLENQSGLLTTFASNEFRKILRVYQGQTLVEPLSFYNPNRLAVTCDFENLTNDLPSRRYRTTQNTNGSWNYANASDRPLLVSLDPTVASGSNARSVSPITSPQNFRNDGWASLVPSVSGCVLAWTPGEHWFRPVTADEPRTHKIRVRVRIGSSTFYQAYFIGLNGENFVSLNGGQWEEPESGSSFRPSLNSLGWRYFVGSTDPGASSPLVPALASQTPNVVLAEGEKVEFRLTWGSGDLTSLPSGWGITWYLDGVPVLSDRLNFSFKTDFLSSGMRTVSASLRQHSVYGAPTSLGYRIFSTRVFVRNTLPFAEPLANRNSNGVGFVRMNNAADTNKFQIFQVTGLAEKGFASLAFSNSVFRPLLLRFDDPPATSLNAPFPTPTPVATHSLSGQQVSQAVPATVTIVGSNPTVQVGVSACKLPSPNANCNKNALFRGTTASAPSWPLAWSAPDFRESGQSYSLATKGTSYRHRAIDLLSFRAGSSDQALLDYSQEQPFALKIRDVSMQVGGVSKFQSIVGGLASNGLEDGSWLVAVTRPDSGSGKAYLYRQLTNSNPAAWGPTELIDVDGAPSGWNPAWVWLAECGECSSNTGRKILFMTRDYRIRWGVLDIDTAQFDEDDLSRSKCSSSDGCVKLDLDPTVAPSETAPAWHLGHLFPKKYSASEWGNDSFVIIERTVGTYRSVNLANGEVSKLAVPGGELTTLHCDNKITSAMDSSQRLLRQRCYVGDWGNEGVNQLR
jgi:hypothetical protein